MTSKIPSYSTVLYCTTLLIFSSTQQCIVSIQDTMLRGSVRPAVANTLRVGGILRSVERGLRGVATAPGEKEDRHDSGISKVCSNQVSSYFMHTDQWIAHANRI